MRIGQNPAKFVQSLPQPARVTVAILVYIPFLSGYYAQSLDVLKICLESIWAHTDLPYDLLVFDNASCPEVRAYLNEAHQQGKIQYLVLSEKNLGKTAAWNFIFSAAPGEFIAYADSDVYFYSGWLSALIKVLETFPHAGMVTGMPMWSPEKFSTSTVAWAELANTVTLRRGKLLTWEDYWRHARSLGQSEAESRQNFNTQEDICIVYNGKLYHVGAGHFQFISRKTVLQQIIPIPADRPMGQVRRLDIAINERGYLRLTTSEWWVCHLGNSLIKDDQANISPHIAPPQKKRGLRNFPIVRHLLQWAYHKIFDWLYQD